MIGCDRFLLIDVMFEVIRRLGNDKDDGFTDHVWKFRLIRYQSVTGWHLPLQ